MPVQNSCNQTITGGAVDGSPIGATTSNTGAFTTLKVGNNYSSPYTLSVQSVGVSTWLDILNNGGANKGAIIGVTGNNFQQYNWQGGDIQFYTGATAGTGTQRMRIKNTGAVIVGGTDYYSPYTLSVQSADSATWIEILNNGGAGKGVFAGINQNNFYLQNYQGGSIFFDTDTVASSCFSRLEITGNGQIKVLTGTQSASTGTGALILNGSNAGIGLTGNVNAGGYIAASAFLVGSNSGPRINSLSGSTVRIRNNADSAAADLSAASLTLTGTLTVNGISALPTIGEQRIFPALPVPAGWVVEDGAAISRTTYSALFAIIGTTFGAGNGSTTFNVPDSRGRTSIGAGWGSGLTSRSVGQTTGAETHTLTEAQMPSHSHPNTYPGNSAWMEYRNTGYGGTVSWAAGNTMVGAVLPNAGGGQAHNNMQPSIVRGYPAIYAGV